MRVHTAALLVSVAVAMVVAVAVAVSAAPNLSVYQAAAYDNPTCQGEPVSVNYFVANTCVRNSTSKASTQAVIDAAPGAVTTAYVSTWANDACEGQPSAVANSSVNACQLVPGGTTSVLLTWPYASEFVLSTGFQTASCDGSDGWALGPLVTSAPEGCIAVLYEGANAWGMCGNGAFGSVGTSFSQSQGVANAVTCCYGDTQCQTEGDCTALQANSTCQPTYNEAPYPFATAVYIPEPTP